VIPKPVAVAIVCLITLVWIGNFAAQFVVPGYQVDGWIHTIFLSVVGGALAFSRKSDPGSPEGSDAASPAELDAEAGPPDPPPQPPRGGAHRALMVGLPWRAAVCT